MNPRHCLVTGANRGLGLEFVRQLLARNDHVVACCRQPGKAAELNNLVAEYPGRLHLAPLDMGDAKRIASFANELPLFTNQQPLNLLINNAGILQPGERWGQIKAQDLDASFRVNAAAPLLLTQSLSSQLATGAVVANISSMIGSIALRGEFRNASYAISKAAQNMGTALMSKALVDHPAIVVALHPGWVQTKMGGDGADINAEQSVHGLLETIDHLTPQQNGAFLDWNGQPLPW